jgi:hypothetical protein
LRSRQTQVLRAMLKNPRHCGLGIGEQLQQGAALFDIGHY